LNPSSIKGAAYLLADSRARPRIARTVVRAIAGVQEDPGASYVVVFEVIFSIISTSTGDIFTNTLP